MESSSASLDHWRDFFRSANADIFKVIEHAILVASADFTQEFRARRNQIVEKLFTDLVPSSSEVVLDDEGNQNVREVLRIKEILTNHHNESDAFLFDALRKLQFLDVTVQVLKITEIGKAVNGVRKHKSKKIRLFVRYLILNWRALVDQWLITTAASADNSLDSVNPPDAGNHWEFDNLMKIERCPSLGNGEQESKRYSLKHTAIAKEMTDTNSPEPYAMIGQMKQLGVRFHGKSKIQRKIESRLPLNDVQRSKQEPLNQHVIPNNWEESIQEGKNHSLKIVIKLKKQQEPSTGQVKYEGIMNKDEKPTVLNSGHSSSQQFAYDQEADNEIKPKQYEDQVESRKKPVSRSQSSKPPKLGYEQKADIERKHTCYQATAGSWLKSVSNKSEEALMKTKLEVTKRKLREGYLQAENEKRQRTVHILELNEIPKKTQNSHAMEKSRNNIRRSCRNSWH